MRKKIQLGRDLRVLAGYRSTARGAGSSTDNAGPVPEYLGFSQDYWNSLDDRTKDIYAMIRPRAASSYSVNIFLNHLEATFAQLTNDAKRQGGMFDLEPDFQRGHVWSDQQQVAFVEALLRRTAPMLVRFNNPSYAHVATECVGMHHADMVCIDGLQRITAIRKFLAGGLQPFGLSLQDLKETPFDPTRPIFTITMEVYSFTSRANLLKFYLDLNTGGTIHTEDELDRVRFLLQQEKNR